MENKEQAIFQCTIVHNLPLHKEFIRGGTVERMAIMDAIMIIATLFYINMLVKYGTATIFLFIAGIFLVSRLINWLRNRDGGISYKQMLSTNDGKPARNTVYFCENAICSVNPDTNNRNERGYDKIIAVVETKNLLLLRMQYHLYVVVDKNTLIGGSKEDFLLFLNRKCANWKSGKVRGIWLGKVLRMILAAVIALGIILACLNLLGINLQDKLTGKLSSSDSYAHIAAELEEFGITGATPELLDSLEEAYRDYPWELRRYVNKPVILLSYLGFGEYDENTWAWTPSTNGVYSFDLEVFRLDTMYSDFLNGVSAIGNGELEFTNIREDISDVDYNNWTGTQRVSFDWNGKSYTINADFMGDWFDTDAINQLNDILESQGSQKRIWATYDDGQCIILFYGDDAWAAKFAAKTGCYLTDDPSY